ncbi:MAG: heptosyltransferase family protein [Hyphomicrobiales bacterium]|nr:heptosyltransferase family protein [Hyphomicrobiales bacterium]
MARPVFESAATAPSVAVFSYEEIIGDGLYKLPVLRTLRAAFPVAKITWITTRGTVLAHKLAPLTQGLVDEFRENSGIGDGISGVIMPMPFRENYSLIIDTQNVVWRSLTLKRLPHGAFVSPAANFRLSDFKPKPGRVKPRHMVDRLTELIELVAGPVHAERPPINIPADLLARAAHALPDGARYIALAPGAGKRIKCWPLDNFIALARDVQRQGYTPAFIIGPDETEWVAPLREAVPGALFPEQNDAWDAGFSPLRTMAIARRCAAAVANDAGVSHMLGAADIPLLTLYGPTDAEKFRPRVTHGRVLRASDFGSQETSAIPLEAVVRELQTLLETKDLLEGRT